VAECFLGWVIVAATSRGICAIEFDDSPKGLTERLSAHFPEAELVQAGDGLSQLIREVVSFIEMPESGARLPLDIRGTAFQQKVWNALLLIQPGETVSYTELAERIGSPSAIRAVARACATNRIGVAIPCHRVVYKNGKVSPYRWGIERKRLLLEREQGGTKIG
jgi:AraC family transcriptional regulator of adaptative response/methylated-DNA-[protein]-cysteine methyltransferase